MIFGDLGGGYTSSTQQWRQHQMQALRQIGVCATVAASALVAACGHAPAPADAFAPSWSRVSAGIAPEMTPPQRLTGNEAAHQADLQQNRRPPAVNVTERVVCDGTPPQQRRTAAAVRFGMHLAVCAQKGAPRLLLIAGVDRASNGAGAPAHEAGLAPRMVVLAHNGCPGTPDELIDRLLNTPPGTAVELVVGQPERQGKGKQASLRQRRMTVLPVRVSAGPATRASKPTRADKDPVLSCQDMLGRPVGRVRAL